jgi:hypothetical protein
MLDSFDRSEFATRPSSLHQLRGRVVGVNARADDAGVDDSWKRLWYLLSRYRARARSLLLQVLVLSCGPVAVGPGRHDADRYLQDGTPRLPASRRCLPHSARRSGHAFVDLRLPLVLLDVVLLDAGVGPATLCGWVWCRLHTNQSGLKPQFFPPGSPVKCEQFSDGGPVGRGAPCIARPVTPKHGSQQHES